jgi:hypothetical protein
MLSGLAAPVGVPALDVVGSPGSVGRLIGTGIGSGFVVGLVGGVIVGTDGVEGVGVTTTGGVGIAFTATVGSPTGVAELRPGLTPPWQRPSQGVGLLLPWPWREADGPPLLLLACATLWASPGPLVGIGGSLGVLLLWLEPTLGVAGAAGAETGVLFDAGRCGLPCPWWAAGAGNAAGAGGAGAGGGGGGGGGAVTVWLLLGELHGPWPALLPGGTEGPCVSLAPWS